MKLDSKNKRVASPAPGTVTASDENYIYAVPVSGVLFSNVGKQEFRLDKVTIFSTEAFLRMRRYQLHFGRAKISEFTQHWLKTVHVIAVMPVSGEPSELSQECHLTVREELSILASISLGTKKRTRRSVIGTSGSLDKYIVQDLFIGRNVEKIRSNTSDVTNDSLFLNADFIRLTKQHHFFHELLAIIRQESSATPEWKELLRSVAVLLGKSQNSIEAADAFLWNMIALEQFLLEGNERQRHLELLLTRTKALLGYCPLWTKYKLEAEIRELYKLRCDLVHEGKRRTIEIQHIIMADRLLRNVVTAILHNRRYFFSKADIILFAEKAKARDLLGMPARPKDWRFSYWDQNYSDKDIEKHWRL